MPESPQDHKEEPAASPHAPANSPQSPPRAPGGRWRTRHVVAAVVVVAAAAAAAGLFVGRATKTATTATAQPCLVAAKSGDLRACAPETGVSASWQTLPQAPIAGRIAEGVVWTGTEMLVWGGAARSGHVKAATDAAAYNPATRTWRKIAPPPPGAGGGATWTGDAAAFWAGNAPDGPAVGAVYDPRTDAWRRLPAGPLGPREGYSSVWTGKELLIISGTEGDTLATPIAAAVDPRTGSWRLLRGLDHLKGLLVKGAVWDGHEVFAEGDLSLCPERGSACDRHRSIFVAYNPATDTAREIDLPAPSTTFGADQLSSLTPIAWDGTDVVFSVGFPGSVAIVRYNPTAGGARKASAAPCHIVDVPAHGRGCPGWRRGRAAPCYIPVTQYTQTAWLGDRYVAACGTNGLQIYSPETDSWRIVTPGESPLNSREGSAIVWTGTDLIAWSGTVYERFNPTPAGGASLTLRE